MPASPAPIKVLPINTSDANGPPFNIAVKGRLEPGRMFLVDLEQGRIVHDDEIKETIAARQPYGRWIRDHITSRLDGSP